jgi:hypothetical protein
MLYDTQTNWVCELYPSSGIVNSQKNTSFREFDMFPSLGDTCSFGSLRVNLNHWTEQRLSLALSKGPNRVAVFFPSPEDINGSSFLNVVF